MICQSYDGVVGYALDPLQMDSSIDCVVSPKRLVSAEVEVELVEEIDPSSQV
jgi:hypothetical protein